MSDEDQLPGVVFEMTQCDVLGTAVAGKKRAKVMLTAIINDDAVWEEVKKKLDGLKVYTADDFKGELLNALREEHAKIEAENKQLRSSFEATMEDNRRMSAALSVLHKQIEG